MIKGNKKTTINLTVLGTRYKYIIPQYFMFELLTYTQMDEKKLAKFIQNNIIDKFKSHKFLVKNGFTRTVNELVFMFILENREKSILNDLDKYTRECKFRSKWSYKDAYLDMQIEMEVLKYKLKILEAEKNRHTKTQYAITDEDLETYF